MSKHYYNEWDPFAAQWLRNLIAEGLLPYGDVDERDIRDVRPEDLRGYTSCHFFAGIGGWPLALRLAGWPDDRPVWTGSPPCQPFSTAGKGLGVKDERHLAPVWLNLIRECRPATIFGEQVAAAIAKDGWLDALFDELEAEGYACGAAVVPACSVGAPHIRQRLWFVAVRLADAEGTGQLRALEPEDDGTSAAWESTTNACPHCQSRIDGLDKVSANALDGFWRAADWLLCRDGKWRPVEPGTFPLANGVSARVGRLRAYGNAIVPQVAAEIIRSVMEAIDAREIICAA